MNAKRVRNVSMALAVLLMAALPLTSLLLQEDREARAAVQSWSISTKDEFAAGTLDNVTAFSDYLELTPTNTFSAMNPTAGADLRDVEVLSGTDVRAVSSDGKILHWNGSGWTTAYSATTSALYGISMVTPADGWAVGNNRIVRYAAGVWSNYGTNPTGKTLYAVDMVGSSLGFAVGVDGSCAYRNCNIIRWNGTGWAAVSSPTSRTLYGIDMVSGVDGWAVGASGKIIRWSGSRWNSWSNPNGTTPTSNTLNSVAMATPTRGWAVGAAGTIIQWDGANWTLVPTSKNPFNGNTAVALYHVHAASETEAWAVGANGTQGILLKWDGNQWAAVSMSPLAPPTLYSLALFNNGVAKILVGSTRTAIRYGGYCGGAISCSGTATYFYDAGQAVTWGSHTFTADTLDGVTSVDCEFSLSGDGETWSNWEPTVYGRVYQYIRQRITLTTNDWTRSPRIYLSNTNFTVGVDTGPNWIPKAGPHDVTTWVYSNKVLVLFTPATGAATTYTVFKHAYQQNRTAVAVGQVTTKADGKIDTGQPISGTWSDNDPWFPGQLVFTDTDVQDFQEYYYYVTDGPYTGNLQDYIVVGAFPPSQTQHGSFNDNTTACTGCHGLHSSTSRLAGRGKLLKATTAVDLCRSCHDGSGSKYDETNGLVRLDVTWAVYTNALAGPFGSALGGALVAVNPTSVHNVGAVTVNQAPGSGMPANPPSWLSELSCISCHEPHNKFRNYRILRGSIHSGRHVRVRAFSEVSWTAPDKSDAAANQEYIAGISEFCSQCHIYNYDEQVGLMDKKPADPTVAANVYGNHRHIVKIQPAFYIEMGKKTVAMDTYNYDYPFEDADPARQMLPNQDLPLEGTYTGGDYAKNNVVCLTCHMAHGTVQTGQKQVAYLNGDANNTTGAAKMDKYGGYTDRENALNNIVGGGSTVLMRTGGVGVCQKCHQKSTGGAPNYSAYVPKMWFWDGSTDQWAAQSSCIWNPAAGAYFAPGDGVTTCP